MKRNEDLDFVNSLESQENAKIDTKVIILFATIVIFFAGAIIWAYFAEIDELTRGDGKVIPSEKIKTIQSLDGGIIEEILVKEGSIVKKGQKLMKIDTTRFQASLQENKQMYEHLLVTQIRLDAESRIDLDNPLPVLTYSKKLMDTVPTFIEADKRLFKSRIDEIKTTISVFKSQLNQKNQEILELKSKVRKLMRTKELLNQERETIKRLVENKAKSKIELIRINKDINQVSGELEETKLSIPRATYAMQEAENRIKEKIRTFKSESFNELQKINTEIKKYESKLVADVDKLEKTTLHSPVDGIIKQINVNTKGGVVKSGMDLIEIVPQSKNLLVEAKIDPKDIAFINPSQKAIVKITAYDFSIYGGLEGHIVEISADSIEDKESQEDKSYYKVLIKTEKNYLEKDGSKYPIIPGMVATVDIKTGKKTILDFILKPIIKTKENALHER